MLNSKKIPLYIPNLIGYLRILLFLICMIIFRDYPVLTIFALLFTSYLDSIDGHIAAKLQQQSAFGAVLDYVSDRVFTIILTGMLICSYPQWMILFTIILTVDIASHFSRLYSAFYSRNESHKSISSRFKLLNRYYSTDREFMRFVCGSYDLFLVMIWFSSEIGSPIIPGILIVLSLPGFIIKNIIHILQLLECFIFLANIKDP